ncbi:phage antirepressor N-terminal domain-containing protein [Chitinibacter sp. S2-10]|uniref:phage antirepressor N-terminal domain-containing protein n=1 Tax=Chitinibacter sp. S2-10 TaxID=3373597 RepID=UPI0039777376
MTNTQHALVPSNTIQFHGHTLILLDISGTQFVAIKPICEAIGLDWASQLSRIKRDAVLNSTIVITTTVAEDGKARKMVCLPISYLNGWLFGIDTARVKPELRDTITLYKRECYQALHDYWITGLANTSRALSTQEILTFCDLSNIASLLAGARRMREAWKAISPSLRLMKSPLAREYHDAFADAAFNIQYLNHLSEAPTTPHALPRQATQRHR